MLEGYLPEGRNQDDSTLITILTYELGDVAKCLHYASIRGGEERKAYLALARQGLYDLITTSRQLAEAKDWGWDELVQEGELHFKERMEDARDRLESKKS